MQTAGSGPDLMSTAIFATLPATASGHPGNLSYWRLPHRAMDRKQTRDRHGASTPELATDPLTAEAHYNLGIVLIRQGKFAEAVVTFRDAIAHKHDYAPAYYGLGNALEGLGKLDAALESHQKAISLDPNSAQAHDKLGVVLASLGRHEEAVASLQKAITLAPRDPNPRVNLGVALTSLGRLEDAIASYKKAIALKPDHELAHRNLGRVFENQGNLAEALAVCQRYIALKPDHAAAHRYAFHLSFKLGDHKAATKHYRIWKSKNVRRATDTNTSIFICSLARMNESVDYVQTPFIREFNDVSVITPNWAVIKDDKVFYKELSNRTITQIPFIEAVSPDRKIFADIPNPSCVVDNSCILLGGHSNYYVWMVDCLPRLALIERRNDLRNIPLLVNDSLSKFQEQSLAMLNITSSRLIKVKSSAHVRCNHLIVPTRMVHNRHLHPDAVRWLRRAFKRIVMDDHPATGKFLFVSRMDAAHRKLLNERELFEALAPLGFQLVVPGQMRFEDQIKAFSGARLVVAPHGAGLTNCIFARDDVEIIEIQHEMYPSDGPSMLAKSFGMSFQTIFGQVEKHNYYLNWSDKKHQDYSVDVDTVLHEVRRLLTDISA